MKSEWTGTGTWTGWQIVGGNLISPTGRKYGPSDIEPEYYSQADLAKALGVTRGAIADRIRRGTLPPFDVDKTWRYETIKHLFET
ncbi:helix-turn-helix domain-containing protein [Brevibacillus composti]|uniref:Helix-turn-helix domain-containing protein n=1 Tax=Brevibacillus composti TaxID=2796470 RepID=A0A7T5EMH2_9BACL|nr:helix-turn-helix domain-containing protein [Brevibacillus composti]